MLIKLLFLCSIVSCTNTKVKTPFFLNNNEFKSVEYVSNYDGDTITVNLSDTIPEVFSKNIPVRIRHIDTAELNSKDDCEKEAALKAKYLVQNLLKHAKQINLENIGRDKYFRLLADVFVDDRSVGKILLDKRLAISYEGGTKSIINWCTIE